VAGWERFTEEKSGREYFYNTQTGKTQWDVPKVYLPSKSVCIFRHRWTLNRYV